MPSNKLHTPEGFSDILFEECKRKRELESKILSIFNSFGFFEIQTPTIEYYSVFSGEEGIINDETMFKFFDRNGKILTLRPEITAPIARVVATKCSNFELPLKACYVGNAFRYDEVFQGIKQREFTQAGVELIGEQSEMADAEVIAVTIEALKASGLTEFKIDIGQVGFFKGLISQINMNNEDIEKLRELIDKKDGLSIEDFLEGFDIDDKIKNIIINLPSYFGGIEVINKIDQSLLNDDTKNALNNLKGVYNILCEYGFEKYIAVDLGMVSSINYYTGIIFKGFTNGVGFPICGGGRYDKLIEWFGKSLPATGVAIGIDRLLSALVAKNSILPKIKIDALIYSDKSKLKEAFLVSKSLRLQGLFIEQFLKNEAYDDAKAYAKQKNIDGIFYIKENDEIEILNLLNNEKKVVSLSSILGNEV